MEQPRPFDVDVAEADRYFRFLTARVGVMFLLALSEGSSWPV